MTNTTTTSLIIPVSQVQGLDFVERFDSFDSSFAVWGVTFEFRGLAYSGYLQADAYSPHEMHDADIEDVELDRARQY
jgi:hypothetical protein